MFHAKNDRETIATWRLDLSRILHVFNVRSVTHAQPPLIVRFQTELAISTNIVVSDVRRDVTNTHTVVTGTHIIVSELQRDVSNTQTIVSDIHRSIVEIQEGTDGKNQSVGVIPRYSSLNRRSPSPRLKLGWYFRIPADPVSHVCV